MNHQRAKIEALQTVLYYLQDQNISSDLRAAGFDADAREAIQNVYCKIVDGLQTQLNSLELNDVLNPDWSKMPDWASWWAVDKSGSTWCYAERPILQVLLWANPEGCICDPRGRIDLADIDWKTTLRERPLGLSQTKSCWHCKLNDICSV